MNRGGRIVADMKSLIELFSGRCKDRTTLDDLAPFDADSPYWIIPNALALGRRFGIDDSEVVRVVVA